VHLVRLERLECSDQGTFGRLIAPGLALFTGELPDHDNAPNVSRIPAGRYRCTWALSPRFKRFMYGVAPVVGRAGIRVHSANFVGDDPPWRRQLNGCIALGERLGWIDRQKVILLSAPAVRRFEAAMNHQPFDLEIVDAHDSSRLDF